MIEPTRVEALLDEALSKSPSERATFLDHACEGNRVLRQEVDRLLAVHPHAKGFLGRPALHNTAAYVPLREVSGTVIGEYKLLEQIGEGGMGAVWMAQQTEPVKRLVAVKLIKAGMDSKQVIARFEAERQALALMDHPNIAKVHDAGTTPEGRPYFVMELVKGIPITQFCDENRLTLRRRLELFVPVCEAIQHAHQKGIIHRDVKPSNVLIALYDDRPVPKVIDFGVAKAIEQKLTEKTLHTGFGAVVGTVEYMSPEQATFNQLDVDTRSDVYSLGVLLYELLTGSPPFSRQELASGGLLETLRVIREEEPTRPSTKLSTADGLPTLAANRGTEPAKLTRLVRGELDWIVMKALEKDRGRRYETANGFAADVQRYLNDEPVQACPPSQWYRLRKFVRRNKTAVSAAVAIFLILLAGIVGTSVGLVRAKQAEASAVKERDEADRQKREAQTQRERSERLLQGLRNVAGQLRTVVGGSEELRVKGREPLLEKLLQPALGVYEHLVQEDSDERDVQAERARIFGQLGIVYHALGRPAKAEEAYRKAVTIFEELGVANPHETQYQNDLAVSWNNLGNFLKAAGRPKEAEEAYAQAVARYRMLLETGSREFDVPRELAECLFNLADLHFLCMNDVKAEKTYGQALDLVKDRGADATPESLNILGWCYTGLGGVYERTGRKTETGATYQKALEVREQLAQRRPDVPEYQRNMAISFYNLGNWFKDDGRWEQALYAYRSALAPLQTLIKVYPNVPEYKADLARVFNNLGIVWTRSARPVKDAAEFAEAEKFYTQAEKSYREAVSIRRELVRSYPGEPEYQQKLADSLRNLGILYFVRTLALEKTKRIGDALPDWERFLTEVKALPESAFVKGETLFGLANHVAWPLRFVPDDNPRKGEYAEQAIRLLKRARAAGYFNDPAGQKDLQEHPRLNRLRQRPDFQQFLAEVLGQRKKDGPKNPD